MEQDPGGNGHVGVGGPDRPGGRRAGAGERRRAACPARVRPELLSRRRALQKGHLCTSPRSPARSDLLEDAIQVPGIGDALQLVLAGVFEDDAGTRDEVLHRRGDEHLVSAGKR
jgi:hypothetical protein